MGGQDKLDLLGSAYRHALRIADELGARTVTAPAISGGTFGFPIDVVADVALRAASEHLLAETRIERLTFVLRGDALDAFSRRLARL